MPFCSNCGKEIENDAKFCSGCGSPCNTAKSDDQGQRRIKYEGEIHKCPQCGEVLDSFTTICPSCGYELRGSSTTNAVKEFAAKLDTATTEYQKESIIRSFPIPNTKEDIFEFMILASSNIDEHPNKNVFNAWIAKFEQCYQKAKLSFKQESDFVKIQPLMQKITYLSGLPNCLTSLQTCLILCMLFLIVSVCIMIRKRKLPKSVHSPKMKVCYSLRLAE